MSPVLQILPLKGSQAQPRVPTHLVSTSKRLLAWEEEEEHRDVAEEDKAVEWRICERLMGTELAPCPSEFSFPWLRAGSSPPQSREDAPTAGGCAPEHHGQGAQGTQGARVCGPGTLGTQQVAKGIKQRKMRLLHCCPVGDAEGDAPF